MKYLRIVFSLFLLSLLLVTNVKAFDGEDIFDENFEITSLTPESEFYTINTADILVDDYSITDFGEFKDYNNSSKKFKITNPNEKVTMRTDFIKNSYRSNSVERIVQGFVKIITEFNPTRYFNSNDINSVYNHNNIEGSNIDRFNVNVDFNHLTKTVVSLYNTDSYGTSISFNGQKEGVIYQTSNNYILYSVDEDGVISELDRKDDFSNIVYTFENSYNLDIDWSEIYGVLDEGEYILAKDISFINNNSIRKGIVNIRFTIPERKTFLIAIFNGSSSNEKKTQDEFEKQSAFKKLFASMQEDMWSDSSVYLDKNKGTKSIVDTSIISNDDEKKKAELMETIKKNEEFIKKAQRDYASLKASGKLNSVNGFRF